jgi:hypothetical protein
VIKGGVLRQAKHRIPIQQVLLVVLTVVAAESVVIVVKKIKFII